MTVRLRPHHLLCLLTYMGRGYGDAFIRNYDRIAARLSAGEVVLVIDGPDDICAPLLAEADAHCLRPGVARRDAAALHDLAALLAGGCRVGDRLTLDHATLRRMRRAFASGAIRHACHACEWEALCSSVAADGFREARIRPTRMPAESACLAGKAGRPIFRGS